MSDSVNHNRCVHQAQLSLNLNYSIIPNLHRIRLFDFFQNFTNNLNKKLHFTQIRNNGKIKVLKMQMLEIVKKFKLTKKKSVIFSILLFVANLANQKIFDQPCIVLLLLARCCCHQSLCFLRSTKKIQKQQLWLVGFAVHSTHPSYLHG